MKKKATSIKIQIPEPCTQDFSKMHPLPGGRYCDHCERTVVDFRGMTDREIVRIYQQRQGRVCGIFKDNQLDRALPLPQVPKEGKPWAAIAALSSALLFGTPASGQSTSERPVIQLAENNAKEKATDEGKVTIEGWVMDEKGEPIPFANILLADMNGTITDLDGYFNIEIPLKLIGTEIKVSMMGYEAKSITIGQDITNNHPMQIELKTGLALPEVVVTAAQVELREVTMGLSAGLAIMTSYGEEDNDNLPVVNVVQIKAYPNPFISTLTIEMEVKTAQPYLFHLYNEAGQLVFAESRELEAGLQTLQLDLVQRHLPEGAYFLRISDDAGEIRTKRLVKVSP
jgi:hypothetical protein